MITLRSISKVNQSTVRILIVVKTTPPRLFKKDLVAIAKKSNPKVLLNQLLVKSKKVDLLKP